MNTVSYTHLNDNNRNTGSSSMFYLKKAKAAGIPVIVIDPRKNDTVLALDTDVYKRQLLSC